MADDNKPLKYMRYAIGEIVLVVIGILIALSINNWNENRNEKQKVNIQLTALVKSFEGQRKNLESIRTLHTFRYNSLKYLLQLAGTPLYELRDMVKRDIPFESSRIWKDSMPEKYNREFVDLSFSWSGRYHIVPPNTSLIDELDRSGAFVLVDNFELKEVIDGFYTEMQWRLIDPPKTHITIWKESLIEDGVHSINTSNLDDPIALLRDNPKRAAILQSITYHASWLANSAEELLQDVENIILMIEQEIDK